MSCRLRDIPHLRFRLVTLTFQGHQRSNISTFFESPYVSLYNSVLLIQTLYLIPFARYSASKISVSDLDLSGSPKVKYFYVFRKPICEFVIVFCLIRTLYLIPFARYSASKISVNDLDLSGSPKVKYFYYFQKAHMFDFVVVFC